jgi:uncharacterized phage protein gp47/JayE
MLESMESDLDTAQGSLAYVMMAAFAIELDRLHDQLDLALQLSFAQTTYGGFLDARAEEHGVFRRPASFASGTITFTGTNGTVIPSATLVSTVGGPGSDPISFRTTEEVTIASGTATADIEAVVAGDAGNVPVGAITQIVGFVSGIASLSNTAATSGGADEESDDLLRERFLEVVAGAEGAGTVDDYERWALEVPGVGFARTTPLHAGAGTVLVQILDTDQNPAAAGLISDVDEYIATLSPIGADVTVATPSLNVVDVEVDVTVEAGFTVGVVEGPIEDAIAAYFETLGPGDDVILTEVGAVIVTVPGVSDYTGLELDTVAANKAIGATEIASLGTVTVT